MHTGPWLLLTFVQNFGTKRVREECRKGMALEHLYAVCARMTLILGETSETWDMSPALLQRQNTSKERKKDSILLNPVINWL